MSRSRRKTPISGVTMSSSNKEFKQHEHRRERRHINTALLKGLEDFPHPKKWGNEWASPRDGKTYWSYSDKCTTCRHGGYWCGSYMPCRCEESRVCYAKYMRK